MEASQAAAATGDGQGTQANGDGEGQAQQGPDLSQVTGTLEQLAGGQEELRQFLLSHPALQQQETGTQAPEAAQPQVPDLSFLDPGDPGYDPEQASERILGIINEQVATQAQALVQQHIEPLRNDMAEDRRAREAEYLIGEFPEMEQPEVQQEVVRIAGTLAQQLGQPELAQEPKFWRIAYMAGRAAEAANSEGGESPQAAHLEGGGGAAPATAQVDPGDLITQAAQGGRSVLPFS